MLRVMLELRTIREAQSPQQLREQRLLLTRLSLLLRQCALRLAICTATRAVHTWKLLVWSQWTPATIMRKAFASTTTCICSWLRTRPLKLRSSTPRSIRSRISRMDIYGSMAAEKTHSIGLHSDRTEKLCSAASTGYKQTLLTDELPATVSRFRSSMVRIKRWDEIAAWTRGCPVNSSKSRSWTLKFARNKIQLWMSMETIWKPLASSGKVKPIGERSRLARKTEWDFLSLTTLPSKLLSSNLPQKPSNPMD